MTTSTTDRTRVVIRTPNPDRLRDFYAYVLDAHHEMHRSADASATATWRLTTTDIDLILVHAPEPVERSERCAVIVDVVDEGALAQLRRRLLCLAATDGLIRRDGERQWLKFRDPDGVALAMLANP